MASHSQNEPPPSPNPTVDIKSLQSSIDHLIASWHQRQQFDSFFFLMFSRFIRPKQDIANQNAEKSRRQTKLAKVLDSIPAHIITALLILLDLSLTAVDLSFTFRSCDDPAPDRKQNYKTYHWIEVVILSLLSAKIVALVVALGHDFFRSVGHVIDGIVMIGALVLEVVAEGKGAGLLVAVSLWRVVRVIESAFELGNEAMERRIEEVVVEFGALCDENRRLEVVVFEKDLRIKELEGILAKETNVPL